MKDERVWLKHVNNNLRTVFSKDTNMSWSAFKANSLSIDIPITPAISSLLPLFNEDSKSTAMIRHSTDVIKKAIQIVNDKQVPVIIFDQPLYAIAKTVQWRWPTAYGENMFVIVLGGLHTEMAILKCLGTWLDNSGWKEALAKAKVFKPGVADSMTSVTNVDRTTYAHQVTSASLSILINNAYEDYSHLVQVPNKLDDWINKNLEQPTFQYWYTTMEFELLFFTFMRSLREGNFQLCIESLISLAPWMFALYRTHYSRWLPVHLKYMISLENNSLYIFQEFQNGNFVIRK